MVRIYHLYRVTLYMDHPCSSSLPHCATFCFTFLSSIFKILEWVVVSFVFYQRTYLNNTEWSKWMTNITLTRIVNFILKICDPNYVQ